MKKQKNYLYSAIAGWVMVGLLITGYAIKAWTIPTGNPPSGNVPAPLNVSSSSQEKVGTLTMASIVNNGAALFKGISVFTPASDSTAAFKVTNAAGTSILNVNTTGAILGISGAVSASGAVSGSDLSTAGTVSGGTVSTGSILGPGGGFTWGGDMTSNDGNISATNGYIKGAQLCIAADCRNSWPEGGSVGGGEVWSGGIILGDGSYGYPGWTEQPTWGVPLYIDGNFDRYLTAYVKD